MSNAQLNLATECTYKVENIYEEFSISAKTSIYRKTANAPLKLLVSRGLIRGSVLNFGKGKYDTDSKFIIENVGNCSDYDYTYHKVDLLGCSFTTVVSCYVVNTLPPQSRMVVWREIADVTSKTDGRAYVAARSDADRGIKGTKYADGVRTSRQTFQTAYFEGRLRDEALRVFKYAREIKAKSGFRIVECSHVPFED